MSRIGIVSDTHIPERDAHIPTKLSTVFKDVDMILHAGDITVLSALDELKSIAPVHAVRGNMDYQGPTSKLSIQQIIVVKGLTIALIHGRGSALGIRKRIWKVVQVNQPQIVVFGHTHQPLIKEEMSCLWINPGSPTDRVFAPYRSVAVLEINDGKSSAEIVRLDD